MDIIYLLATHTGYPLASPQGSQELGPFFKGDLTSVRPRKLRCHNGSSTVFSDSNLEFSWYLLNRIDCVDIIQWILSIKYILATHTWYLLNLWWYLLIVLIDRWCWILLTLVGGFNPTPLKNIYFRQLGWWHSQYMESHNPVMFQSPPTRNPIESIFEDVWRCLEIMSSSFWVNDPP